MLRGYGAAVGDDPDSGGSSLAVGSYVGMISEREASWDVAIVQVRQGGTAPEALATVRRGDSVAAAAAAAANTLEQVLDDSGLDNGWLSGLFVDTGDDELRAAVVDTCRQRFDGVPHVARLPRPIDPAVRAAAVSPPVAPAVTAAPVPKPAAPTPAPPAPAVGAVAPSLSDMSGPPLRTPVPADTDDRRPSRSTVLTAVAVAITLVLAVVVANRDDDSRSTDEATPTADGSAPTVPTFAPPTTSPVVPTATIPGIGDDAFSNSDVRRLVIVGNDGVESVILADTATVSPEAVNEASALGPFVPGGWTPFNSGSAFVDYPCRGTSATDDLSIAQHHWAQDTKQSAGVEVVRFATPDLAQARLLGVGGNLDNCGWAVGVDRRHETVDPVPQARGPPRAEPSAARDVVVIRKYDFTPGNGHIEGLAQFRLKACLTTVYYEAPARDTADADAVLRRFNAILANTVAGLEATTTMCKPQDPG